MTEQDIEQTEPWLRTINEVAQITGRHPKQLHRWIANGTINAVPDPDYKAGRNQRLLIPEDQIEVVMAQPTLGADRKPIKIVKRETVLTFSDGSTRTINVSVPVNARPAPLR